MSLQLLYHPLASYCWKVLIALYENGAPFEARVIDLAKPEQRSELLALWPVGKFPVLRDSERGDVVPESSIIIDYLDQVTPAAAPLIPREPTAALQARLWDRFFDAYVHEPMQKIVADHFRAEGRHDADGVAQARATLATAYAMLEQRLPQDGWAAGGGFGIADCAAFPALFYAGVLAPFADAGPRLAAYFDRLCARTSVVRTIKQAQPCFPMFPMHADIPPRFFDPDAESFARG